ncbi:unnamed protein product [Calicophoron daubneyi]|uniref:Uncharacterized protein n=1 Tax=Calicophoron daubneyi TaxID=300641 RepID=A0AAV2TR30_CALDB
MGKTVRVLCAEAQDACSNLIAKASVSRSPSVYPDFANPREEKGPEERRTRCYSDGQNPAELYVTSVQHKVKRLYRELVLNGGAFLFRAEVPSYLIEDLCHDFATMGLEVDSAIFDLHPMQNISDEFYQPLMSRAFYELESLIRVVVSDLGRTDLHQETLCRIVPHWFVVCRLHLLRSWLLRTPKRRGFFPASTDVLALYQLLAMYGQATLLRCADSSTCVRIVKQGLAAMKDIAQLNGGCTCHPSAAAKSYHELFVYFCRMRGSNKMGVMSEKSSSKTVLFNLVLFEAQMASVERMFTQVREFTSAALLRTGKESLKLDTSAGSEGYTTFAYDKPIEVAFAVAGVVAVMFLLGFLGSITYISGYLPRPLLAYKMFFTNENQDTGETIRNIIVMYWLLAPLCVWLNLEIRLRFAQMFNNRFKLHYISMCYDRPRELETSRLGYEINLTWRTYEKYDQRLSEIFHKVRERLARKGMPILRKRY